MNLPGTAGESSCKRQENGDRTGPERPLKKARYAWEVKGKYHLRNEISEGKSKVDTVRAGSSSEHDTKLVGNTEQNLEILGDYLLKQDFNTLDSITDSNTLLPSASISTEKLSYPRYVSSFESNRDLCGSSSNGERIPVQKSSVYSNKDIEDQCIARWQARQMAKCFVDNTINRVLDNWMMAPLPADMENNRVFALDAAEFINNLPGDNSIENEAILMAISAHGLQNNSSSYSKETSSSSQCNYSNKDPSLSPPSSLFQSDDETIQGSNPCNNEQNQIDESSSNDFDMPWSSNRDVKQSVHNYLPPPFYPDASNFSYQYFSESDNPNSSNTGSDGDENINSNDNNDVNNHYDFLDAAVSFAIQYKGLTSYGTDYG